MGITTKVSKKVNDEATDLQSPTSLTALGRYLVDNLFATRPVPSRLPIFWTAQQKLANNESQMTKQPIYNRLLHSLL